MKEDEAVRRLSARRRRVGLEVGEASEDDLGAPSWSQSISPPAQLPNMAEGFPLGKGQVMVNNAAVGVTEAPPPQQTLKTGALICPPCEGSH